MNGSHVDSISAVDLSKLTYKDIRWMYGTGRSLSKGSGREKTYTYRSGVMTKIGDIEESVWLKIATEVVKLNDDMHHYNNLCEMLSKGNYRHYYNGPKGETELHKDVLSHCVSQNYNEEQWVCFVEYNQTYRLDYLDQVKFTELVTECCNTPVKVPKAQTNRNSVCCPICGRFSEFEITKEDCRFTAED